LLPVYVLLLVGERIAHAVLSDKPWNNKDAAANIVLTGFFLMVDVLLGAVVPVALFALIHKHVGVFTLGTSGWAWLAAFVLYDLAWYIDHRIGHRTGFFWAMHQIHHSSNEYNMPVASRGFVFGNTLLSRPTFYLLAVFGFTASHLLVVKIVTNVWGIAQHMRLVPKLGILDWLFATPSSHRVHHGSDDKYLDRKYGEVLMIWDHLFGSYQVEEEEPTYGLVEPLHSYNLLRIETDGFARLSAKMKRPGSTRDKLRCLYKPPGWEPAR
jgi:sterol desaturase/sphingolipid hydroxylase (fatty acid hydroxylase superfamily)